MNQPTNYKIKKWLYENTITGCKIHCSKSGLDNTETDWELFPSLGKSLRCRSHLVQDLVEFSPDWVRLFKVKDNVRCEVENWQKFEKEEEKDLNEFKRLREKFSKSG